MGRNYELDARHDIDMLRRASAKADISAIRKLQDRFHALVGIMWFCLVGCKDTSDICYVLTHCENTLDMIPLLDTDGTRVGTFIKTDVGFKLETTSSFIQ